MHDSSPVVLQVLPSLQSGGVERGTIEIAAALHKAGFTALVASSGGPMTVQLRHTGATHFTLPLDSKNPWVIWKNSRALAKLIKAQQVDIIHARSRAPAWSAWLAAKMTGCKLVTTFHGIYNFKSRAKHYYNSIMTRGEKVIAISNFTANHIRTHYACAEPTLTVIPRGADMEYFNPKSVTRHRILQTAKTLAIPEDKRLILLPGRLTRWKGHFFLLEALHALEKDSFACIFVGDDKGHGEYRNELEARIKEYNLQDNVFIKGNISDMPAAYQLADIIVSASLEPEAFGRVAIEAQAMGKLLVATNIGGSCETVIPGKTGWLVTPNDTKALAAALQQALALTARERKEISLSAREHIQNNFSLELMCSKTLSVYRELLPPSSLP